MTCPDCAIKDQEITDLKKQLKEARAAELVALRSAHKALDQRDAAIKKERSSQTIYPPIC